MGLGDFVFYHPAGLFTNKWKWICLVKDEMHNEPAKLRDIVNRAKTDPYERVRIVASKLEQALNSDEDVRSFERLATPWTREDKNTAQRDPWSQRRRAPRVCRDVAGRPY